MSKNVTDDVLSSNYGDVLMSAVEGAKEQFSEEEYEKLKADAEQIRTIEEKIAEISASDASSQPEDAAQGDAFPQFSGKDLDWHIIRYAARFRRRASTWETISASAFPDGTGFPTC